jgi:peptidyl-prolyl cis-trans isomerase C
MPGKKILVILFMCAMVSAVASCQKRPPSEETGSTGVSTQKDGAVLASVNGEVITIEDFQDEIDSLPEYTKNQLKTADQKRKRLDNMIKEILLRQEAVKRGLDKNKEIQRKVDRYRNRLITEKLYQDVAQEKGKIDDAEVQKYYDENKNQYVQKERIRASQILILLPPNAEPQKDAEARAKAEEVLKRARSGEDFSELAKQTSEGPTAVRGGDLGYFQRGRMVPEFEEVAFSLKKVGDVSDVVKTKFGYHVVKLTDKQAEKMLELDEVKERIVRQLESKNRREIRQTLDQDLQNKANVVINEQYIQEDPPAEEAQK